MVQAVSTMSFSVGLRQAISLIRQETARRQVEMQTGTMADPGLTLGGSVGRLSMIDLDISRIESIAGANKVVASRLEVTQASLEAVKTGIEALTDTIGAGIQTSQLKNLTAETARKSLAGFASTFNVSLNGEHVFAGINSSVRPFADEAGMQGVAEIDAAFVAHFGFAKTDPAAASISPADFQTFLNTQVEPIFAGAIWGTSISSAADQEIRGRIEFGLADSVSVTANETAVRSAFYASSIVAAFVDQPFNQNVLEGLVGNAAGKAYEAQQQLADLMAKVGLTQSRVIASSEKMSRLSDIFEATVSKQIAVDPYESGLRLNELLNTLETTILISQRIQNLSFVKLSR
jgi:flagellar hook-associated protein 3 FlgL